MLLVILKSKKLSERFTKKNSKKQIKKTLELKKVIKRKGDMSNEYDTKIRLKGG